MKRINDFGEKIGGARKDLWASRGLIYEDTENMTSSEKNVYVKRDQIWSKIKDQKLLNAGCERFVVYWQKEIQKAIYPDMKHMTGSMNEGNIKRYIDVVTEVRDIVMSMQTTMQIKEFAQMESYRHFLVHAYGNKYYFQSQYKGILKTGRAFIKMIDYEGICQLEKEMDQKGYGLSKEEIIRKQYFMVCLDGIHCEMEKNRKKQCIRVQQMGDKDFYYSGDAQLRLEKNCYVLLDKEKHQIVIAGDESQCQKQLDEIVRNNLAAESKENKKGKRKSKWIPPQLAHIKRLGENYRNGRNVTGQDFIDAFGIRAGEFGNWTNDLDRQENLNMCFDAFIDLADALNISRRDIGLPGLETGALALAFGSRGHGNAQAHYEPTREVINLTKMKGAGSLAHEWGHALDDLIGKVTKNSGKLATENLQQEMPAALFKLVQAMEVDPEMYCQTQYYVDSKRFNSKTSKDGQGYWNSRCELFARAFACYIMDRLKGRNDYLCGHANQCKMNMEDGMIYAYPRGEERKTINRCFDELIKELKQQKILHEPIADYEFQEIKRNQKIFVVENYTQLSFDFVN